MGRVKPFNLPTSPPEPKGARTPRPRVPVSPGNELASEGARPADLLSLALTFVPSHRTLGVLGIGQQDRHDILPYRDDPAFALTRAP